MGNDKLRRDDGDLSGTKKQLLKKIIPENCVPISGKYLLKLFLKAGYVLVAGGKGSHWKLKKKNSPTVIIPNHKELKKGTEHALRKILDKAG